MKALSLWQPWAHAVAHLGKRIENRGAWHEGTPALAVARKLVGKPILIHAAKGCGARRDFVAAVDAILDIKLPRPRDLDDMEALLRGFCDSVSDPCPRPALPRMALVARATLADVAVTWGGGHRESLRGGRRSPPCSLCGAECAPTVPCPKADPWAQPGVGLVLADVVPLATPVPYAGRRGWFDVPEAVVS